MVVLPPGLKDFLSSRGFIVLVEVFYLVILFTMAIVYVSEPPEGKWIVLGPLPVGVPWFGALGAVLISLTGTFDHRTDWNPTWISWHLTRPLIGVTLAIVAWLVFQTGAVTVGSTATATASATDSKAASLPTEVVSYLIAFIVGYREELFRNLIKRVADVLLSTAPPAATGPAPIITGFKPAAAEAKGGTSVTIDGSGFTGTTGVMFGTATVANPHVVSDTQITVFAPAATARTVDIMVTTAGGTASRGGFTYS